MHLYFQLEDLSHVARTVHKDDFMVVNDLVSRGGSWVMGCGNKLLLWFASRNRFLGGC